MVWFMICLLLTSTIALTLCVVFCLLKLKSNSLSVYVRRLLSSATGVTLFNVMAMVLPHRKLSLLLFAFYNIFETLTMITLFSFICAYTNRQKVMKAIRVPLCIVALADSVIMLINPFRNIVFNVEILHDDFGNRFFRTFEYTNLYGMHTAFVVFLVVAGMLLLLQKITRSPRAYIIKYSSIFMSLCVLISLSMFHLYLDFQFDYSIGLYAVEGIIIFYFSLIYVPRGLMDRLMFYTVENLKDGIICVDIDGHVVHANDAAINFCHADDSIETVDKQVLRWNNEDVRTKSEMSKYEITRRINNERHHYNVEYREILDNFTKSLGYFYSIHDRTEEYTKYENEKYRATHDKLTGLYNKEHFYETVEQMMRDNPDEDYNIIVTDVKNFKIVNDVFGVEAGDALLKKIAVITEKFGGSYCVYARLMGDRFALCIPRRRYSEENLLSCYSMADSFFDNSSYKTHIHIGVYEVDNREMRVSVMCDHAMLAIRTIKDSFRNRVAYYRSELRESFIGGHRIISEFETSIANNHFCAYIQPQISFDGAIRGGEVLVRWFHPTDGVIRPDKFIKILEETGLISRLDKYMWELACKQLKRWTELGSKKSYLSINISRKDFYLLDVYEVITSLAEKYGIEPQRLHLEVTESAIMDSNNHLDTISRLRKRGFIVEIDDFGSGYSSLNMLKDFDADVLKIDMGFLQKNGNINKSRTILKMIITLAKSLDMKVITEGVEHYDQVRFLKEYGCDIFQGFYFAKPMSVEDFEKGYLNKKFRMK